MEVEWSTEKFLSFDVQSEKKNSIQSKVGATATDSSKTS